MPDGSNSSYQIYADDVRARWETLDQSAKDELDGQFGLGGPIPSKY